jgi:hypothetical protein
MHQIHRVSAAGPSGGHLRLARPRAFCPCRTALAGLCISNRGRTSRRACAIFLIRPTHDDHERIIRQWPLQCLGFIPWRAHPHVPLSSVVRITCMGLGFGWSSRPAVSPRILLPCFSKHRSRRRLDLCGKMPFHVSCHCRPHNARSRRRTVQTSR